ncbi:RNA polymerase III RPC4-domain-containing protein [Paraphysoderma sedebokerense]|nr:RNA polymerase III RPC4-domain-containing protein [Paraphysoderma sedebokerense]
MIFTPNIPTRRAKKEGGPSLLQDSIRSRDDRKGTLDSNEGRGRGRGEHASVGPRGRGRGQQVALTASGPFSMGPSAAGGKPSYIAVPGMGGSSSSRLDESDTTNIKIEDDDIRNTLGDDDWVPIVLPEERKVVKSDYEVKTEPDDSGRQLRRKKEQTQSIDVDDNGKEEDKLVEREELGVERELRAETPAHEILPSFDTDPDLPTTALDKLFLFQFPPVMPEFDRNSLPIIARNASTGEILLRDDQDSETEAITPVKVKSEDDILPPGVKGKEKESAGNGTKTNMSNEKPKVIEERLKEGQVGKLMVSKSGKMKLRMGHIIFDITNASQYSFLQQIVVVDSNAKQSFVMGNVSKKFNCTPNLEVLLTGLKDQSIRQQ